jgi:four helix bundle protein
MTNSMVCNDKRFDLEERTSKFGGDVIKLCRRVKQDTITRPLISQLIRSATSVGANYCEANGASSKKDFRNKIHICQKEAKETKHWLRMISDSSPEIKKDARKLWQECHEFTLIFGKVTATLNAKKVK